MGESQTVVTPPPSSAQGPSGTLGQYTLVRKVADGGMAEIFLAKQIGAGGFERNVIIKRILPQLASSDEFVSMFLDEARLAAKFSHPNIVQVTDAGLADGAYYLCMEYLAGEDFATLLRSAALKGQRSPLGICVKVVVDAAHGLHYAHEFADESGAPMNVVHRDVSPSNIFVTYQGAVKVLDFGIAKAESRATHTRSGTVKGKFVYMSPEQTRGINVDRRSDVFALGICLYEALTGVRPFARENDLAVMNAIMTGEFHPLREMRPDLPEEIERIVHKAMRVSPDERYATAMDYAQDLERFLTRAAVESNSQDIARYMRALVGENRIQSRIRIPSLETLIASGSTVKGFTDPLAARVGGTGSGVIAKTSERATNALTQQRESEATPSKKRNLLQVGLIAAGVCIVGAGSGLFLSHYQSLQREAANQQMAYVPPAALPAAMQQPPVQAPIAAAATPPADAPPVASPTPTPTPTAPDIQANPPDVEPKQPAVATTSPRPRVPKVQQPTRLDAPAIQKVVMKKSGSVGSCFETHKGELTSDKGEIRVQFTILSSGKVVNAKATGTLTGTQVAGCVERQVAALRFPTHQDKEITLELPFSYRVNR